MERVLAICVPVYNDWQCALLLLDQLDAIGAQCPWPLAVYLIDDGSTEPAPLEISARYRSIASVEVLQLRRNVGHQRAIALAIAFVNANVPAAAAIIMDADGEDAPKDIPRLLQKCEQADWSRIVFAARGRRTERLLFRLGYAMYRKVHHLLTGRPVKIGNFSVIPASLLPRVVGVSELWNHYAAGVVHARLPMETVAIDRARRYAGEPKMNFVSLVTHGMSAISVFGDIVGVRLLCLSGLFTALAFLGSLAVVAIRVFTERSIPGWATSALGLLVVVLLNLLTLSIVFVLFVLQSRNIASFLPVRDWENYVASRHSIYNR